ncbi:hypothetical protein SAMN06297129_3644 [Pseudooceanicola antarcticus]|uniref:Uncharacterized protein n=1 Tax=Pseudooceanicola antarcticus TaxID=1247613 RepID=A0A285JF59_9RHOB|nr:hypothetical protein [Pseudooceanicola antarcticus]PJE31026.1 hypothetical protein CVM39_04330 [Pseudooceanicola antarcticus]SNY58919.1 hypothetical protein SAMN06297129_3644 [Pseudooceanicola antarcticus]
MQKEILAAFLIMVPTVAFFLGGMAHNKWSYWLLRIGGLTFALVLALSVLTDNICLGSLTEGFSSCANSTVLAQIMTQLSPVILLGVVGALTVGPLLLLTALGLELYTRYKADAA